MTSKRRACRLDDATQRVRPTTLINSQYLPSKNVIDGVRATAVGQHAHRRLRLAEISA